MITHNKNSIKIRNIKKNIKEAPRVNNCLNHHIFNSKIPGNLTPIYRRHFCSTSTEGVVTSLDFRYEALIRMILVLEDRYESFLFTDTENVPVAIHLTSQWHFNDVNVRKTGILRILDYRPICQILGICDLMKYLIMKESNYYNIQRKFQVHSTKIFGLGAKTNTAKWQPPLYP